MKRIGNIASNKVYNPQNTKPDMPFDADEVDSAMERFIRQKYQDRTLSDGKTTNTRRHDTGSSRDDDAPPPLPPKNGSKFGFRSASSIFPLSSKAKKEAAARAQFEARDNHRDPSPPLKNKASQFLGSAVETSHTGRADGMDKKMAQLQQMGFHDEHGNLMALQRANGDIYKALDVLVKMAGSSDNRSRSRSRTPLSATAGITIERSADKDKDPEREKSTHLQVSNNPFDMPRAPPQSSQSTGTLAQPTSAFPQPQVNANPYQAINTNPFGLMQSMSSNNLHQQYSLDQSLQNLSINPPPSLFPNNTGGFVHSSPYQAGAAAPLPTIPQHYQQNVFDAPIQQSPVQQTSYNPFLQQPATQPQSTGQPFGASNPFGQLRSQTDPQQNPYYQTAQQQPQQQQQAFFNPNPLPQNFFQPQPQPQPQQQQSVSATTPNNPWATQQPAPPSQPQQAQLLQQQQQQQQQNPYMAAFQPQPQQQQQPQQQPQLLAQPTGFGKVDKSSILALYNYPHLAPQPTGAAFSQSQQPTHGASDGNSSSTAPAVQPLDAPAAAQPRSFSSPLATVPVSASASSSAAAPGSKNPFIAMGTGAGVGVGVGGEGGAPAAPPAAGRGNGHGHVSQDSIAAGGGIGGGDWFSPQNGRHSPDAFAGLASAWSVRG
jgi:hypothetical protein